MKQSILFLAAASLLGASCQLSQGPAPMAPFAEGMQRSALGVNQYESTTTETPGSPDVDTDALRVNFTHGWFLNENLEVGGMLGYSNTDTGASDVSSYTIDAYGRWYFDNRSRIRTWAQAYAGIGNRDNGATDDDLTEFALGIGISDMFTESTSLDVGLDYRMQTYDTAGGDVDVSGIFLSAFFSVYYGR